MNEKTKVLVFVSGGLVSGVRSNQKDIEVEIIDFDNLKNFQEYSNADIDCMEKQKKIEYEHPLY